MRLCSAIVPAPPDATFANIVRVLLAILALALLVSSAVMLGRGVPGFVGPLVGGFVLLIGVVFERWRYKPVEAAPGAGFSPTAERFLDPTSGEPVQVWTNPATGERRYVRDTARGPAG
jgi:hypothetical protein